MSVDPFHVWSLFGKRPVQLVSTIGSCCCLEGVGIERAGERNGRGVSSVKFLVHGEQEWKPVKRQGEDIT